MRDGLQSRSAHDVMRLPLGHNSSRVEHNDLVAEGKDFFAIVGDEENRDAVILVPLAKIGHQRRLRWPVQRSQWLIEQQSAWFGDQPTRQGDALALPSGDVCRSPAAQTIDAEARKNFAAA